MSNEELCKQIQNGRRELIPELIEQNSGIIYRTAKYYYPAAVRNRGADMDDLRQTAVLGMIEAVTAWKEDRGVFLTIASLYMRREVRALLGLHTQKERIENAESIIPLSYPAPHDEEIQLLDLVEDFNAADPQESACTENMREIVRESVQTLPQEQREAVTAFYFQSKRNGSSDRKQRRKGLDRLSRMSRIAALMEEYQAHADRGGGLQMFRHTHTSAVEYAVMQRERIMEEYKAVCEREVDGTQGILKQFHKN